MRRLGAFVLAVLAVLVFPVPGASAATDASLLFPPSEFIQADRAPEFMEWLNTSLELNYSDLSRAGWENRTVRPESARGEFGPVSQLGLGEGDSMINLNYDSHGFLTEVDLWGRRGWDVSELGDASVREVAGRIAQALQFDLSDAQLERHDGTDKLVLYFALAAQWGMPIDCNPLMIRIDRASLEVDWIELSPWYAISGHPAVSKLDAERTALAAAKGRPGVDAARVISSRPEVVNGGTVTYGVSVFVGNVSGEISTYFVDADTGEYLGRRGAIFVDGVAFPVFPWALLVASVGAAVVGGVWVYKRRRKRAKAPQT